MTDEKEERLLFITDPELPEWKQIVKEEADRQGISSTSLIVSTLCKHYKLTPPVRQRRPAREVADSETLALSVPTELWQAIHVDSGERLTSKKGVVLGILAKRFAKQKKAREV